MKLIAIVLSLMVACSSFGQQKFTFNVRLLNTNMKDVSQYQLRVKLVNRGFDRYWIQDTSYLASMVQSPFSNLIHPILWRKIGGKYILYENLKNRLHSLPAKCLDSCCNCMIISKGDSMTFTLPLLKCCNFEKGQYKMIAYLRAPIDLCHDCEETVELESNYVYFTIKD